MLVSDLIFRVYGLLAITFTLVLIFLLKLYRPLILLVIMVLKLIIFIVNEILKYLSPWFTVTELSPFDDVKIGGFMTPR
jgi:hypothetical protein